MTKLIWDTQRRKFVEKPAHSAPRAFNVIPDLDPFKSVIDGAIIGSRSTRRDHMRQHGVVEAGDIQLPPRQPRYPTEREVGESVKRAFAIHGHGD